MEEGSAEDPQRRLIEQGMKFGWVRPLSLDEVAGRRRQFPTVDAQRRAAFEYALNVAGFRPMAIQAYASLHDVVLPDPANPAEGSLDSALSAATDATNWGDIGRQLSNVTVSKAFNRGFVKVDDGDPTFVFLYAWSENLTAAFAREQIALLWDVVVTIGSLVHDFSIDEPTRDRLSDALDSVGKPVQDYDDAYKKVLEHYSKDAKGDPIPIDPAVAMGISPFLGIAIALAKLLIEIGRHTTRCNAVMVLGDTDGMSKETTDTFENPFSAGLTHSKQGLTKTTVLNAIGFDVPAMHMHGHTPSLDLAMLNRQMAHFVSEMA